MGAGEMLMPEPYRVVSALPAGTSLARYIQALALGCDDMYTAVQKAETWTDTPHIAKALELRMKAAVSPMSTSDATAAGPLALYGVASEAITLLRGMMIFGALEPRMQRVPLHVKIPIERGTGFTGGWVAEGAPIPVQKTAFATSIEEFYKFGVITPLAEELVTTSDPAATPTINRFVLGGLGRGVDTQFLTPTIALSAGVNPASILNGATEITTTGTTSAQNLRRPGRDARGGLDAGTARLGHEAEDDVPDRVDAGITSGRPAGDALRDSGHCEYQQPRPDRLDRSLRNSFQRLGWIRS
jgi:hypothetical protein